jgi:hypothetical protein
MDATKVIRQLLKALPDSYHINACWNWCWNELDDESQEFVKQARQAGEDYLAAEQAVAADRLPACKPRWT